MFWFLYNIYRITAVMKVETDSIAYVAMSPIEQAAIVVIL